MSDELSQPTPPQPDNKPTAPPVIIHSTKAPPSIPATAEDFYQGLVKPMRFLLAFEIVILGAILVLVPSLYIEEYWEEHPWQGVFSLIALLLTGFTTIRNTTAQNILTIFRCNIAFGIPLLVGLALWAPSLVWRGWDWPQIWTVILLVSCGLFAVMSVMVIIGGAFDVRKLLRRLREQEVNGDSDTTN